MLTCPGLYRLIFQSLYHTSLISARWEIDEIVNFQNFRKLCSEINLLFFQAFWHSIFKQKKRNEVAGHIKHTVIAVTCTSVAMIE